MKNAFMKRSRKDKVVKILYIEADLDTRAASKMLEECVSSFTTSFIVAPNAFSGLECIDHTDFEIIFIDGSLHAFGAEEFLKVLRIYKIDTPLIYLAKYDDNTPDERISSAGFDGVLRRPFSGRILTDVISKVLETRHARIVARQSSSNVFAPSIEIPIPPSILPDDLQLYEASTQHSGDFRNNDVWDDETEAQALLNSAMTSINHPNRPTLSGSDCSLSSFSQLREQNISGTNPLTSRRSNSISDTTFEIMTTIHDLAHRGEHEQFQNETGSFHVSDSATV